MEKTLWKLALGGLAGIILTEVNCYRVKSTFPVRLAKSKYIYKYTLVQNLTVLSSHHTYTNNASGHQMWSKSNNLEIAHSDEM